VRAPPPIMHRRSESAPLRLERQSAQARKNFFPPPARVCQKDVRDTSADRNPRRQRVARGTA
jgi:hypothetical protein